MKILNFGSLNFDFVYSVDHFVTAGETLSSSSMQRFIGGKGLNQSIALSRAGAAVYHAGCIGVDGLPLVGALQKSGVNVDNVFRVEQPSGHAIIQVDKSGQNCIMLCSGANREINIDRVDEVLRHFSAGDLLVLQNEISCLGYIMISAHGMGMKIALNPSPMDESVRSLPLELVDIFALNEQEGAELSGKTNPEEIIAELRRRYPNAVVLLTLGSRGAMFCDDSATVSQPIIKVKAVDTTGAGDTFTGYFLAGYCAGQSPQICLELATAAAAMCVSKDGASDSIPTAAEVAAFLRG